MGHYTELRCRLKLKKDLPEEALAVLKRVCADGDLGIGEAVIFDSDDVFKPTIDHPFFKTERWYMLLLANNFDKTKDQCSFEQNSNGNWILSIDSEYKNYDGELEKFFDWITPYLAPTRRKIICLGQWDYENHEGGKFNIYLIGGQIQLWAFTPEQALQYQQ